uniref:monodehydroascorbate reductase (NADH) n=1 Tax=Oryza brachyantha TaxID=4533 RepID=J3LGA9_ORYBR
MLEEFGISGSDASNICYLRSLDDADKLENVMKTCPGGNAVVIGGGYIGMECAAALVTNRIKVTMVFPENHCMARLFTPKIAEYYENYYTSKGVTFVKGTVLTSFEKDSTGKVTSVILKDDMVVVGIGIRASTSLFEGQLLIEQGGIKVNGQMLTSDGSVYAVGDVAAFPIKLFDGAIRRLEHVDSARRTARHAVTAILEPSKTRDIDYLPFFYSRVFTLSWQFYGNNIGEVVHFGDFTGSSPSFGAYWVDKSRIRGAFLEGGSRDEYDAISSVVRRKVKVTNIAELEKQGLMFAIQESQKDLPDGGLALCEKPSYIWHATAGVIFAPYERPALSKGYLLPQGAPRLPAFHTCVGSSDELLTEEWYNEHGIVLILGTRVVSADVPRKTLLTSSGETISYKTLIVATGARAVKLEEFRVRGSDARNVCYLRNVDDADKLVGVMGSCPGGNAVVVGGGYIGMECAAALVNNNIKVTMVFPGKHCMDRFFTPKIAEFYESYYTSKGVAFVKEAAVTSMQISAGKVTGVLLGDGRRLPADMVVVGVGARANTGLFDGQLAMEKGGIKVNGRMQASDPSVYAVGDVAAFPVKLFGGDVIRLEHVDCARRTARHAVAAILDPSGSAVGDIDYLPFFYSRVFSLSWQFYGDNVGEAVPFGDLAPGDGSAAPKFGAYWVREGRIAGAFLEGGSPQENEAVAAVVRRGATVADVAELERRGLAFATQATGGGKPSCAWHATVGVAAAVSIAALACWYGWQAPYVLKRDF